MRIVYVVPGPMPIPEMERRGGILKEWAAPDAEVDIVRVTEGPASIESSYEEYLSIGPAAREIYRLEQAGYDAAILGCAGDPGLDAMREITTSMLVTGPGSLSLQAGAMLANRVGLLTITDSMVDTCYELAHKAGVAARLCSVRPVEVPVLELAKNREQTLATIIAVGRAAMEQDRAQVLVLGCMSMGFLQVAEEVEAALGVPVINPARVALHMTEALVRSGYSHSKRAYTLPPKLATGKVKSLDELTVQS